MTLAAVIVEDGTPRFWSRARASSQFPPQKPLLWRNVQKEEEDLEYLKQSLVEQRMRFEEVKRETIPTRVLGVLRDCGLVHKKKGRPSL